jgi:hypothetical protein
LHLQIGDGKPPTGRLGARLEAMMQMPSMLLLAPAEEGYTLLPNGTPAAPGIHRLINAHSGC